MSERNRGFIGNSGRVGDPAGKEGKVEILSDRTAFRLRPGGGKGGFPEDYAGNAFPVLQKSRKIFICIF